jgi:transcriptional regulator with XRE-family HTH domain
MKTTMTTSAGKKLGDKLREARVARGFRQADLAKLVGISPQSISAFESGRIPPSPEYLQQIAYHTQRPLHIFTGQKIAEALARVDEMITELQELKSILSQVVEQEQ